MVFIIISIMALVALEKSSAIQILGCSPNTPLEVEENTTKFLISCVNIHQDFDVFWYLSWRRKNQLKHTLAVDCLTTDTCLRWLPFLGIEKANNTSVLDVTEFLRHRFLLTGVTCRERNPHSGEDNSYTCNIDIKISAIRMLGCDPGTSLEVEEVATNFQVSCVNIHQGFDVFWYLSWIQKNQPKTMLVVDCLTTDTCLRWLPFVDIDKSNAKSVLNITGMIRKRFHLTGITCRERHPHSWEDYSYTCNIRMISPPEISCNIEFSQHTGVGTGTCDVTKIHFRERPYTCTWFQTKENSEERTEFAEQYVTNYKDDGTHVNGTCTTIIPRPSSGHFIYEVLLLPDGLRVKATLSTQK